MKISYIANSIIKLLLGQLINFRLSFESKFNKNLIGFIKSLNIILFIGFAMPANAFQVPTITSFSPPEASIGTEVIIEGTNFSTVISENTVKFNGVTASVNDVSIDTVGYILDDSQVNSVINFVNFTSSNDSRGILRAGPEAFETRVEIRFGAGLSQKAHRFICFTCAYQDYVDVPFEVWDLTNNRQLMVSFRDRQEDGTFNLLPRNTDGDPAIESREYIYISNVAYDAVNPDPNIAIEEGQDYKDMYFLWPHLADGATWDPANMAASNIIISYDPTIRGTIYTNIPTGASTGPVTVQVGAETATSSTNMVVLSQSFASVPYNPSDGGDFETNQSTWQVEHSAGTSFELGNSPIAGKNGTASGSFAWVTGVNDATYIDNSVSSLVSPSFNFSSTTEYKLGFKSKFQLEDSWDGFIIEYSVAGGSWEKLNNYVAPGWYNRSSYGSIFDSSAPIFSGSTNNSFDSFETDLSFLAGNSDVRFKFKFLSDTNTPDTGMALDDFSITPAASIKTFSFNSQLGESSIGGGIVNITVPSGTDLTSLIPNFTLTNGASANVSGIIQTSGNTALDFTNPVIYTVVTNVSVQQWVVTVTKSTPYAYYPFNNNFLDESGAHNGTELTSSNAFIDDRLGFTNSAFQFNNNFNTPTIELQNTANVDFGDEITVSAWIRPQSYDVEVIQLLANQQGGIGIDFNLVVSDLPIAEQSYKRRLYAGITGISYGSFGEILLDRWTHVAFRYQRNVGVDIFINGVNQGRYGFIAGTEDSSIPIAATSLTLGTDYHGRMDEVKIFNTALSDQDIYSQFNVNRWPFQSLAFRGPEGGNAIDWQLEVNQAEDRYIEAVLINDPGPYSFRATGSAFEVFMGDNELNGIAEPGAAQINMTNGLYAISFRNTDFEYEIIPITSVGIIGSAFPDGWDSDIDFTDLGNGLYGIQNLNAMDGEWKIRVNDDWYINWGSNNNDGILNPDANNINISAGNYNITVDIVNKTYNVVVVSDLEVHYTFNGNATDQSGNGNNGNVNGATLITDRYGSSNSAYAFNGTSNDFIDINGGTGVILDNDATYSMWIYPTATQISRMIWDDSNEYGDFSLNTDNTIAYDYSDGTNFFVINSTGQVTQNAWNMVTLTREGASISFYIDGVFDKSATAHDPAEATIITDIARGNDDGSFFFNGNIDEVRIYGTALSVNDILTIYNEEKVLVLSSETEITAFSMSEQTSSASIGSGTIELTVGTSTNITSLIATFNLSEGAIATVNGTEQFSGSSANNFSNTVTYVVTAADGSTQNWNVSVTNVSGTTFVLTSNPSSIDASSGSTMSVDAVDNSIFNNISFAYRGISDGENANFSVRSTTNNGTIYSATLNGDEDLLGIEYKFIGDLTDGSSIETEVSYLNIAHSGEGLQIPGDRIKFSDKDSLAYRAISIPLNMNNGNSNTIFAELGDYKTDWRMYSFNSSGSSSGGFFQEQSTSGASIQLGKGYFILAKSSASIFTGIGSTPSVTPTQPVEIQISPGWNLIGNPYNFSIDWLEVLEANTDVSNINQLSNQLKIWLGSYNNSNNHLLSFQGGFVFSSEAMSIKIPVTRNTSLPTNGGRLVEEKAKDLPSWVTTLSLKDDGKVVSQSKVGMHENANISYDKYDLVTLPSLTTNASLKIEHPEFFIPSFSSDFVPNATYYEWKIEMTDFKEGTVYKLDWKLNENEESNQSRVLYDISNQKRVDMSEANSYSFTATKGQSFKVLYGNIDEINNKLLPYSITLGDIYPNPAQDHLVIPYNIPEINDGYNIEVSLYNLQGKKIITFVNEKQTYGFHQITWNRISEKGTTVPSGLYIVTMKIDSTIQSKKIILD